MLRWLRETPFSDVYELVLGRDRYEVELPCSDACSAPLKAFIHAHQTHAALVAAETDSAACARYAECCSTLDAILTQQHGPAGSLWGVCVPALNPAYVRACGNLARVRCTVNAWRCGPRAVYVALCDLCECMSAGNACGVAMQAVAMQREVIPRMTDAAWELCMDMAAYATAVNLIGVTACAVHMASSIAPDCDSELKPWMNRWKRACTVLQRAEPTHADLDASASDHALMTRAALGVSEVTIACTNRCLARLHDALASEVPVMRDR
ncbi:hypothetical protein CYMTET_14655 [Cymbomonas tetramitiformis]|uniref:Uncharacterized protein n=1 Tax=Cymbomonas tetramitiformis TaxID=36881 RepID=A0AAE0GG22_9CHLO|nr:hypothetical protein CYMTET_14655 [Cymbomonas tetramitiformis]